MGQFRKASVFMVMVFASILFLSGTSCSQSPSEDLIKETIIKEHDVKRLGATLETVRIKQVGKFNKQKNYWPVKAEVTYKFLSDGESRNYEYEYGIYKDDYGEWRRKTLRSQRK